MRQSNSAIGYFKINGTNYYSTSNGKFNQNNKWTPSSPPNPLPAGDSVFVLHDMELKDDYDINGTLVVEAGGAVSGKKKININVRGFLINNGLMDIEEEVQIWGYFRNNDKALADKIKNEGGSIFNLDTIQLKQGEELDHKGGILDGGGTLLADYIKLSENNGTDPSIQNQNLCGLNGSNPSIQLDDGTIDANTVTYCLPPPPKVYTSISSGDMDDDSKWSPSAPPEPLPSGDSILIYHAMNLDSDFDIEGIFEIKNSGSISGNKKIKVKDNGKLINGGLINITKELHVDGIWENNDYAYAEKVHNDGSICNSDSIVIKPGQKLDHHGGTLDCGGTIITDEIKMHDNSGVDPTIQNQNLCDTDFSAAPSVDLQEGSIDGNTVTYCTAAAPPSSSDCTDCNTLACDGNGCTDGTNANGVQTNSDCGCGSGGGGGSGSPKACAKIEIDLTTSGVYVPGDSIMVTIVSQSSGNTTFYISDNSCTVNDCDTPDHIVSQGSTFSVNSNTGSIFLMVCKTGGSGRRNISISSIVNTSNPSINAEDPSFTKASIAGLTDVLMDSWSVVWGDYNGDGYDDLFLGDYDYSKTSRLFTNQGDGSFASVSSAGELFSDLGSNTGASWGDYDNDGDLDLFAANNVRDDNHLYQNQGDGTFSKDERDNDLASYGGYCHNAAWVDYDNDGWLDLFVTDYMPTRFNKLYHNDGDGTFTEITNSTLVIEAKYSIGAVWADYDNDGLQDLFVPNDRGENNSLYHNDGNGKFTAITSDDIVNDGGSSTGASWGDIDNDGDLDLFVANAGGANNFLYRNNGNGTFTKDLASVIATDGGQSHGSVFADFNKDGYLDLFVGNNEGTANFFYVNQGDGSFSKSSLLDAYTENTMAVAVSDYDLDGDLDLFLGNQGNTLNGLCKNEVSNSINWKAIKLEGVRSNRSGIGSKVRLKANIFGVSFWQTREINAQSGGGASGQSSLNAFFGLGDASNIDSLVISWPSGFEQVLTNLNVNDCETITEADGAEISGIAFYDLNNNCVKDAGEEVIPNLLLQISPGPRYVTTNDSGEYRIYRQYGTYTISPVSGSGWTVSDPGCSIAHGISYSPGDASTFAGNNFAMQPACADPDLATFISSTALRRGFVNTYAVSIQNKGAVASGNFDLVVVFNNDLVVQSASVDWDQLISLGDSTEVVWNFSGLESMEQLTIQINDSVSVLADLGKNIKTRAFVRNGPAECQTTNNESIDNSKIVGSVDPNDILVKPEGEILISDTLHYRIRFQNVGNYFASRVVIKDTLSKELDLSTLEIMGASHVFDYRISEDRLLSFSFPNIFLPDSISNEAESHGFVDFKVLPLQDLPIGTIIENSAQIQFDYNAFIETNIVQSRITSIRDLASRRMFKLVVAPHPVTDISIAYLTNKVDGRLGIETRNWEIYNLEGKKILSEDELYKDNFDLNAKILQKGFYILRAFDPFGIPYTMKLQIN